VKRIFLIHGNPNAGKSYLATQLSERYSFRHVSVDQVYVEYIKSRCPKLYFDDLSLFIAPHYHCILAAFLQYPKIELRQDLITPWYDYLLERIRQVLREHEALAVEGYAPMFPVRDFQAKLSREASIFLIEVSERAYRHLSMPMTVEEIAGLSNGTM